MLLEFNFPIRNGVFWDCKFHHFWTFRRHYPGPASYDRTHLRWPQSSSGCGNAIANELLQNPAPLLAVEDAFVVLSRGLAGAHKAKECKRHRHLFALAHLIEIPTLPASILEGLRKIIKHEAWQKFAPPAIKYPTMSRSNNKNHE